MSRLRATYPYLLGIDHPLPVQCSLQARQIGPGDRILLYTDGLIEARNKAGEQFGNDGLSGYVSSHTRESNKDLINGLLETVHKYSHSELQDDVLCLSVRIK